MIVIEAQIMVKSYHLHDLRIDISFSIEKLRISFTGNVDSIEFPVTVSHSRCAFLISLYWLIGPNLSNELLKWSTVYAN